ncbi:hypothetical protein HDU76_008947, partial [Blyttiomyces sp. JEL0837]
ACRNGQVETAKLLMATNFVYPNCDRLVEDTVIARNTEILDLVLKQQGVSPQLCQRYVKVAITMAAGHNYADIVKHLLENFEVGNDCVNTGIQEACESMSWDVVKILVQSGM